jgi:hypothetical protein
MKKAFLTVATTLALAVATVCPVNMFAVAGRAQDAPAGQARGRGGERHPEIHKAMRHLQMAKEALHEGAHDFSGHRAEALKHTDEALEECRRALQADEK